MLLMIDLSDEVVGEIKFYPITHYLTGYELSYLVFGRDNAGRGYATEAVGLLTAYLFARLRIDRVQLNIHPDNEASRRVAEQAGYTFEGAMRSCWFHRGDSTTSRSGRWCGANSLLHELDLHNRRHHPVAAGTQSSRARDGGVLSRTTQGATDDRWNQAVVTEHFR